MQDSELRLYLRQYLESAIDQDKKLKKALSVYAHILKSGPGYRAVCAQLTQLSAREAISEKLLEYLDAGDTDASFNTDASVRSEEMERPDRQSSQRSTRLECRRNRCAR